MQQMGSRMVRHDRCAAHLIDTRFQHITDLHLARGELADMRMRAAQLLRILNFELHYARRAYEQPRIADLPTAFRVERRVIEHDLAGIASVQYFHALFAFEQRHDRTAIDQAVITAEVGLALERHACAQVDAELTGSACTFALCFHRSFEARLIDGQTTLAGDVGSEINWESERVVQLEYGVARQLIALKRSDRLIQQRHALRQRLRKALFFLLQHALDMNTLALQLWVRCTHLLFQRSHQCVEERLGLPELVAMTNGATNDSAQDIPTPL